jgi:hypothetical protein
VGILAASLVAGLAGMAWLRAVDGRQAG